MTVTYLPTVCYHPTLAPKGRLLTTAAAVEALNDEWVDTPTKFPPAPEPTPTKKAKKEAA